MNEIGSGQTVWADYAPGLTLLGLAVYIFYALCLYKIARNCGEREDGWWAFVPGAQILLMLRIAEKPTWWFWMFIIPVANLAVITLTWIAIARACYLHPAWGALAIIPLANVVALTKLAVATPRQSFFQPPQKVIRSQKPLSVR